MLTRTTQASRFEKTLRPVQVIFFCLDGKSSKAEAELFSTHLANTTLAGSAVATNVALYKATGKLRKIKSITELRKAIHSADIVIPSTYNAAMLTPYLQKAIRSTTTLLKIPSPLPGDYTQIHQLIQKKHKR